MWITPPEVRIRRTCRSMAENRSAYAGFSPCCRLNKIVDNAGEINPIRTPFSGKIPISGLFASGTCVPPRYGGAGVNLRAR